jgi:hypothetical protein
MVDGSNGDGLKIPILTVNEVPSASISTVDPLRKPFGKFALNHLRVPSFEGSSKIMISTELCFRAIAKTVSSVQRWLHTGTILDTLNPTIYGLCPAFAPELDFVPAFAKLFGAIKDPKGAAR